jgi:hypothetical protein
MTQNEQILTALEQGDQITPIDALERFGCLRLGARIHDLRQKGHAIHTEHFHTKNGAVVARYSMGEA